MKTNIFPAMSRTAEGHGDPLAGAPAAARVVCRMLAAIRHGSLILTLPDQRSLNLGSGRPVARVRIDDWSVFASVLARGDIGFAEAWIEGHWSSPDLAAVLDVMVGNRTALERIVYGSWLGRWLPRLRHALNRNHRRGSRRNIQAHYDLGNDFYALWLDPGMTYSSALFDGSRSAEHGDHNGNVSSSDLMAAQERKYQRLFDEAGLRPGQRVLEIGCGWGGFVEHATRRGVDVTGLTLSSEQLAYARRRLAVGPANRGRADLRLQDYRDHLGSYDAIVSIEMFEAVGEAYWPQYFQTIARSLAPNGRAAIQTIVIAPDLFERYRRGSDFIQQYVFPGGMLPSRDRFVAAAQAAGLRCVNEQAFGLDYATTLQRWRQDFHAQREPVLAQGYDERFIRLWDFYLAYCESAFRHRNTDVVQFTLTKAEAA